MLTGLNVTASGAYLGSVLVWTGSGVAPSSTSMTMNCSNWISTSASVFGFYGVGGNAASAWWISGFEGCAFGGYLYCFER